MKNFLPAAVVLGAYPAFSILPLHPAVALAPLLLAGLLLVTASDAAIGSAGKHPTRAYLPLALFLLSYAASTALSIDRAQSLEAAVLLFPGLLFIYIYRQIAPLREREQLLCTAIAVMVITASLLVISSRIIDGGNSPADAFSLHDSPALVVPNDVLLCVISLPLAALGLFSGSSRFDQWLSALAIVLCIVAVLLVRSRVCFLTLLLVISVTTGLLKPRLLLPMVLGASALLFATDYLLGLGTGEKLLESWSRNERLSIWRIGLAGFGEHLLFGSGPNSFEAIYRSGLDSAQVPTWMQLDSRIVPWAHNIYLEALLERGIIGLLALLGLLWFLFRAFLAELPRAASYRKFPQAVFSGFCAFLFAGLFELTLQRSWVVMILFVFVAISLSPADSRTSAKEAKPARAVNSNRSLQYIKWCAPLVLAIAMVAISADMDRARVAIEVNAYCNSLADKAKAPAINKANQGKSSCVQAFDKLLEQAPEQFFREAGQSAFLAWLHARWWQLDLKVSGILAMVLLLSAITRQAYARSREA